VVGADRGGAAVHPPDPHGCRRRADPAVCECRWVLDRSRKELSRARARAPQAGRRNDLLSSGNVEHSLGAVACWTGSRGRELAEEATSLAPARAARAHRRQIAHAPALPGASLIERSGRRTSSSTMPRIRSWACLEIEARRARPSDQEHRSGGSDRRTPTMSATWVTARHSSTDLRL
jgi:hypothetical protein